MVRWREAMATALYGPEGFFVRPGSAPAAHFRTSAHVSPLFARAILRLLERVDETLGHPDRLDVVDVGAGRGELLSTLLASAAPALRARLRPVAVEQAPPPVDLVELTSPEHHKLHKIWRDRVPEPVTGLLMATEWLDNMPVDAVEVDPDGTVRYLLVNPATGEEALGEPVTGPDADWLARWWPLTEPGTRAEIGRSRDDAWAGAVVAVERGTALAVDYGHLAGARPPLGTLTGFRQGREVPPVPDGSCDLTAHVALDALAAAGTVAARRRGTAAPRVGGQHDPPIPASPVPDTPVLVTPVPDTPISATPVLVTQREALRGLGVTGARPPLALAAADPAAYVRELATASAAVELTDPAGLGGHHWLLQPVGLSSPIVGRWLVSPAPPEGRGLPQGRPAERQAPGDQTKTSA